MKRLVLVMLLSVSGSLVQAQDWSSARATEGAIQVESAETEAAQKLWICYFSGKQSFGGPVGDIWQTVRGEGPTQLEAINQAQNNCFGMGLSSCMMRECHQAQ